MGCGAFGFILEFVVALPDHSAILVVGVPHLGAVDTAAVAARGIARVQTVRQSETGGIDAQATPDIETMVAIPSRKNSGLWLNWRKKKRSFRRKTNTSLIQPTPPRENALRPVHAYSGRAE